MKWYSYLICFILCLTGVFSGITLYKKVTAQSYINGSITIENQFSMESFKYTNSSLNLSDKDNTGTYSYEIDLLKITDFNGIKNKYQVKINDYILTNTTISAGSILSVIDFDFYNTDGEVVCNATVNISIKFLSDKTVLNLSTVGSEQAAFVMKYFEDNGIRLYVNKILEKGESK